MRSALRSSRPSTFTNSRPPSGVVAKYGVDPRASTLAGLIDSTGSPTRARPAAIDVASARRAGAPSATSATAPANQPITRASSEPNDMSDVSVRVTSSPITATQPACLHRRPSHGAPAVSAAASTPMPMAVGNHPEVSAPRSLLGATTAAPLLSSTSWERSAMSTAAIAPPSAIVMIAAGCRMAVHASPPTSTTTVRTRVPTTMAVSSQLGSASSPRSRSEAKATSVSPNSHSSSRMTTSATAATARRRKSAGDRTRCASVVIAARPGSRTCRPPLRSVGRRRRRLDRRDGRCSARASPPLPRRSADRRLRGG